MTSSAIHVNLPAIESLYCIWSIAPARSSAYLIKCSRSDVIIFVTIALIITELMVNGLVVSNPKQIVQLGSVCYEEKYAEAENDVAS